MRRDMRNASAAQFDVTDLMSSCAAEATRYNRLNWTLTNF